MIDLETGLPTEVTVKCCPYKSCGNTTIYLTRSVHISPAGHSYVAFSYERGNEDIYAGLGPTANTRQLLADLEERLAHEYYKPKEDAA